MLSREIKAKGDIGRHLACSTGIAVCMHMGHGYEHANRCKNNPDAISSRLGGAVEEKQAEDSPNDSPRTVHPTVVQPGYTALPRRSSEVNSHSGMRLSHKYDENEHVDLVPLRSFCGRVH